MKILVLNSGSSSIKFQLVEMPSEKMLAKGLVEKIGEETAIVNYNNLDSCKEEKKNLPIPNHDKALEIVINLLTDQNLGVLKSKSEIAGIGHRIVHGGETYSDSVIIDEEVKKVVENMSLLAPLHNPPNLLGILSCEKLFDRVVQVGVFDTAFHQNIPEHAYLYAIPYQYYIKYKLKRYGFHGTSHRFVSYNAAKLLNRKYEDINMISCHLGNGASVAAIRQGKTVDTSMGFTPLEGLIMGTRTGDIDPSLFPFLMEKENLSFSNLTNILNKKSGLLGVSGISNDMRTLEEEAEKGNKRALLAIEMFAYRLKKYISSYLGVLGKTDVIIFTGGIGENSPSIRSKTLSGLEFFGIRLDPEKNRNCFKCNGIITTDDSSLKVAVIRTNEELLIARDTYNLINKG